VLEWCVAPLGVPLDLRDVLDPELLAEILQHLVRHVQRIGQEAPDEPGRGQLEGEAETGVCTAPLGDQRSICVIEEEEPLQLRLRRSARVPAVRGGLAVTQELNWQRRRK
jgi:hypothetical protein